MKFIAGMFAGVFAGILAAWLLGVYLLKRMGFGYRAGGWRDSEGRVLRVR